MDVTQEQYGSEQGRLCKQPAAQLQVEEQGSLLVDGKMITNPGKFDPLKPTSDGQTHRGDHAYVFYQVPVNPRKLPLILWHGFGQRRCSACMSSISRAAAMPAAAFRGFL